MSFSKLKLTQSGLAHEGKQSLAWPQVAGIAIERRRSGNLIYSALVVWAKGSEGKSDKIEWVAKRITMFPNFDAFVELAGRFTKIERAASN